MEQSQGWGGQAPAAQSRPQQPSGGTQHTAADRGSLPVAGGSNTGPGPAPPAAVEQGRARDGKPRRQRNRKPKQQPDGQPGGAAGSSSAGGGGGGGGGGGASAQSLTWQQQDMLSAAAPAFVPAELQQQQQQQQQAGRGQPPRDAGRGRGGRQGRGRGRGRGRGGVLPAFAPFEPPTWQQQEQWQYDSYAGGPSGPAYYDGPGSGAAQGESSEPQFQPQQQQQEQQQRPPSGQRRRERPPRDPAYAQQRRGAGGRQQQLEAAASVAANRRQQQRQAASAAEEESGQQSSSSDEAPAAASAPVRNGAGEEGAAGRAARRPEMPRYDPQQRERRQRRDPAVRAPGGRSESHGAAAAGEGAPAAAEAAVATTGGGAEAAEAAPEAPHCLVCTSPMAEVAIGACNHKEVCGQCTLRLRLCYGRHDCPLCKAELKEVIIALWRPQLPDWDFYLAQPEHVARSAKWARGEIWADRWRRGGRLSSRLLHDLQRRTALACCVCDPGGESPFMRREQLLRHVQEAHDQRLCSLCLQEGRLFPLELEAFPSFEALQAHSRAAHPHCDFCRRTFYDDDALWKHMHQAHYSCHVCPPPVAAHAYFNRAPDLMAHMREEHFLCEEPECTDCFVAFASADELRRHHLERHSARMPRWDPSRARTLQLDISYTRRGGPDAAAEGRRRRQRPQGPQDVRVLDGPERAAAAAAAAAGDWPTDYAHETDGGLRIIDDADFPSAAAAYSGSGGGGPGGPGAGGSAGGGWAGRQRTAPRQRGGDEFPSLSTAAGGPEGGGGGAGREAAPRPPPLVKKSAKCPCGRRVSHYAVQEGEEVPPLECDAMCRLEGRKAQLADAFGVADPGHHLSYWDSHRNATYSGLLLATAQAQPRFIEGLERQLAAFVADKDLKRQSLSAMPREQRQVVHQLAEQYGLATTAYGQEPGRYIELFKTPSAGIPSRLLSRVAPTVPAEEVAALLKESEGHPMRLTDIALSADVRFYLRRWEGAYSLEWQGGDAAVVRFERDQDLKDALDTLGGGIRGLFRVDRSWRPKTAVATVAPGSSSSGGGRGWAGGEASGSRDGADGSSTWTAVAVAPPAARHDAAQQQQAGAQQQQQQQQAALGDAGVGRWAVMAPRRTARAAPAPTPAPIAISSSRNLLSELTPELEDVHTSDSE